MKPHFTISSLLCFTLMTVSSLAHQTIGEKMAQGLPRLSEGAQDAEGGFYDVNQQIVSLRSDLAYCYEEAKRLHAEGAAEPEFQPLLHKVNTLRDALYAVEKRWHASAVG